MSKAIQTLERAALSAHRRGDTWNDFWPTVAERVRAAVPYNRQARKRLIDRLLHLLVCGDLDGQEPPAIAEPWERDDAEQSKPADVGTNARWQGDGGKLPDA
jgi:hypothetical protein